MHNSLYQRVSPTVRPCLSLAEPTQHFSSSAMQVALWHSFPARYRFGFHCLKHASLPGFFTEQEKQYVTLQISTRNPCKAKKALGKTNLKQVEVGRNNGDCQLRDLMWERFGSLCRRLPAPRLRGPGKTRATPRQLWLWIKTGHSAGVY